MKRIAALLTVLMLLLLCGCSSKPGVSVLCPSELLPSASALCEGEKDFSFAASESDLAAVQQLESGNADCVLLTAIGAETLQEEYALDLCWSGGLTQFLILSTKGTISEWTKNTRVVIVGENGNYADFMAQQVLTCAFYGSVRYEDETTAVEMLKDGKADVVMGFFSVQETENQKTLLKIKNLTLESIPETLVTLKLPGEDVEKSTVLFGGITAESVVVPGAMAVSPQLEEESRSRLISKMEWNLEK